MRRLGKILGVLGLILVVILAMNWGRIWKLNAVVHLFDEDRIVQNFQNMDSIFNVSQVQRSSTPFIIPTKTGYDLPATFEANATYNNTNEFLSQSRTEGLMIVKNDSIIYEFYSNGLHKDESHISWSMSKSFTSAIAGILVNEGLLDITKPVSYYLDDFDNTGYESVTIKNLLQMSSGVGFNEDYGDFNSDINRFGRVFALGNSLQSFAKTLNNERPQGTYNHYVSMDTQVLGLVMSKVSGKSFTTLLHEYLWEPLGMQDDAQWIIDNTGFEVVLGGLNATLRDYTKLGLLYLNEGNWQGKQIVPQDWVEASITPDAAHLKPNQSLLSSNLGGYGYQWWLPQFPNNDFLAKGIYDQYIYVNKEKRLVITKLSANHHFKTDKISTQALHEQFFQYVASTF